MLRFLAALLREDALSVCYEVVPAWRELKKEEPTRILCGIYFDDNCRATENENGDYCLENELSCERKMHLRSYCSRRSSWFWQLGLALSPHKAPLRLPRTPALVRLHRRNSRKCGAN